MRHFSRDNLKQDKLMNARLISSGSPFELEIEAGLSDPRMKIEIEVTARHNNGTE